jgi:hypothetical protein
MTDADYVTDLLELSVAITLALEARMLFLLG